MREAIETGPIMAGAQATLPQTAERHVRADHVRDRVVDAHAAGTGLCQHALLNIAAPAVLPVKKTVSNG